MEFFSSEIMFDGSCFNEKYDLFDFNFSTGVKK